MQIQHVKGKVKLFNFGATAQFLSPEAAAEMAEVLGRMAEVARVHKDEKVEDLAKVLYDSDMSYAGEWKHARRCVQDSYRGMARQAIDHLGA